MRRIIITSCLFLIPAAAPAEPTPYQTLAVTCGLPVDNGNVDFAYIYKHHLKIDAVDAIFDCIETGEAKNPALANSPTYSLDLDYWSTARSLAVGDATWIKRISLNIEARKISIISDNKNYPLRELSEDDLTVIGRG